jgi:hypothetical protein
MLESEVMSMFMAWLIALLSLVFLLAVTLVVISMIERGDRRGGPHPDGRRIPTGQPDQPGGPDLSEGPKAAA